jgi:hypothetical protein
MSATAMNCGYYLSLAVDYRNRSDRAFSAHRLWMNLWTSLGQPADNCARPGGNSQMSCGRRPGVHTAVTARPRALNVAVDGESRRDLAGRALSPGSTDPMTTTFIYLSSNPRTKQASSCPDPGGSVR